MTVTYQTLFSDAFLRAIFDKEFLAFRDGTTDKALIERLDAWSKKDFQKETSAEIAFVNLFFEQSWGYTHSGKGHAVTGYTCYPKFPVAGAGAEGGIGEADCALGFFGRTDVPSTPQVLCEFKDVRSNLDRPQKRKGNNRSPVKQCADYLREAMKPLFGNEAVQPTWGLVTDMNEFRLYWRSTMPSQYQRFIIKKATTEEGTSLLENSEAGSFQRFLFLRIFHSESLISEGGSSALLKLLKDQRYKEREIENLFYREYRSYREHLVKLLIKCNPKFPGTKGRIVRLAQKFIDRCIFVMFCEDMGEQLSFPPHALRDYLSELSKSATFESEEQDAWNKLKELFHAMNEGKKFRSHPINKFNGGLFAVDPDLDGLAIPNEAFCAKFQGENDKSLKSNTLTLLYFAGSYNFGAASREGQAITLYTLGRIFEQSITELEVLEAEAEKRPSLTLISKRKRDGVYYTPEWVVERVVAETLGPRLDEIRGELGWSFELEGDEAALKKQVARPPSDRTQQFKGHAEAVRKFRDRLDTFTVLDPACGSGAFLIYSLEYLLRERRRTQRELALVTGGKGEELFEFKPDEEVRHILSKNIFGVDINASSVEIARLALWLHTAKSDQPLSNLDTNIVEGNSLVGSEVFDFKKDLLVASATKKETINAFDYEKRFKTVFDPTRPDGEGFDCIVGNPPYVKFQNFKKVYPETADFLRNSTGEGGLPRYKSCQTGLFDLYLPFIERGLELLNKRGRLGYIAPSLWRYNEYGEGLCKLLHDGGHLDRWIDFGSFQVFDEAIIYTALQFYSRQNNDRVRFALAPKGELTRIHDWDDSNWFVTYKELPKSGPWILVPRHERAVMTNMSKRSKRLDDPAITRSIFVGIQTSADHIYHLRRLGKDRYSYQPPKPENAKEKPPAEDVTIEDAIMHPLVSGYEVQRYTNPTTETYILFPYDTGHGATELIAASTMEKDFPHCWNYLKRFEKALRSRESNKMNKDDSWWGYNYPKNLEKQKISKILVPRLCLDLGAVYDSEGQFYQDNVDVGGIEPAKGINASFLTGVLNSSSINFVWKRIAKPFQNGYLSANKQFIAPLPIPNAAPSEVATVVDLSSRLTDLHSRRRDALREIGRRFNACDIEEKPEEWLWPVEVRSKASLKADAPKTLSKSETTRWAKAEYEKKVGIATQALQDRLRIGACLKAEYIKGELRLSDESVVVLDGVFVDKSEAELILLNWNNYLRKGCITETSTAADLSHNLRTIRKPPTMAISLQIAEFDAELRDLDKQIAVAEKQLNALAYKLFALTSSEIEIVEKSGL
jgi:hypothetical protein